MISCRRAFTRLDDLDFAEFERDLWPNGRGWPPCGCPIRAVLGDFGRITRALDMRYVGQEHLVTIEVPARAFRATGSRRDQAPVRRGPRAALWYVRAGRTCGDRLAAQFGDRLIANRSSSISQRRAGEPPRLPARRSARHGSDGSFVDTPVFDRALLESGNRIRGPALIEEHASTTVLLRGDELIVDPSGNLLISVGAD